MINKRTNEHHCLQIFNRSFSRLFGWVSFAFFVRILSTKCIFRKSVFFVRSFFGWAREKSIKWTRDEIRLSTQMKQRHPESIWLIIRLKSIVFLIARASLKFRFYSKQKNKKCNKFPIGRLFRSVSQFMTLTNRYYLLSRFVSNWKSQWNTCNCDSIVSLTAYSHVIKLIKSNSNETNDKSKNKKKNKKWREKIVLRLFVHLEIFNAIVSIVI